MPDAGIVPSAQADGKVRQLAGGTRVASLTHCGETASRWHIGCSGPGLADSVGASATAMAADVPCARCRHRAVGLGRRQGPAASPTGVLTRVVKPQAQVSGTSTTTANQCKGPRRYQCLSRFGRSHTHTHACTPTARDSTRSIIGMRDLQAAAASICVCDGGQG